MTPDGEKTIVFLGAVLITVTAIAAYALVEIAQALSKMLEHMRANPWTPPPVDPVLLYRLAREKGELPR